MKGLLPGPSICNKRGPYIDDPIDVLRNEEVANYSVAHSDGSDFSSRKPEAYADALSDLAPEYLRTVEAQLKGILESTAEGILAIDAKGKVIQVNSRFAEVWQIPKQVLEGADGQTLLDFVLNQLNDQATFENRVHALHGSATEDMDLLKFKDGRIVEHHSLPMMLDGSIIGRVWSFRDITRQKLAEKELHESIEQFRSLVEQAMTGILIIQGRRLAYVNPRVCEIHGYALQHELVGANPLSLIIKKDRRATMDRVRPLLIGDVDKISHDLTALRKNGTTVEVGICSSRASYRGRPAIIVMTQDITEKKHIEDENQRYIKQLKTSFMSTVEVATIINEMRDPYTAGHERRVADIAVAIGAELGFDTRRQEGLHIAGHLHDIGKINIPAEILAKPGKLSAIEFQLIQEHAQASYDVLRSVDFPWPVAQVALQHHERMDGSGYPQGLKGEAILLEARIMAVADVFEAMSSHRPYRAALGIEKALDEIERGRGTSYDADVADACLRLIREVRYQLPV
ncbi:MAG: PAS domain S-box protein [Sterolibacterium sp.]|nr:PAS domain S-box protein [Sterolibacterium sp.]